ncbi:hypothetical protein MAPG_10236 [Magnaporthiopsis poae ATCC 64411]|uniref:Uncharacterized protein n=1 Tax=Magnaporthiopsis poae (strain ATCC 64411 / 73-15) TaxID=644358 RepID=A0A0C4EC23_MAGP6|nr:hypothetical protein MAPG_10236 [Magnaporthiopsis poae ATCC 64411]
MAATQGIASDVLGFFRIRSPFGDPAVLTVPFITVSALVDYLRREATEEGRGPLDRRMKDRLVGSATRALATGGRSLRGAHIRPLLTGASAVACDGAIRPAHAVTDLGSLWGLARATTFGEPAISSGDPTDSIAFWAKEGHWPEDLFRLEDTLEMVPTMEHLLGRKKSLSNLSRKRSNSATSTTPSDQKPREAKRTLLATKGSFMDESAL